jgi:hypothetical protein
VNGLDLSHYKPQLVYDLPTYIADYLIASGSARLEMRVSENPQPPSGVERRQHSST